MRARTRQRTADGRACEWPEGCNRGALREVDTAPIGKPGRRWLCLHHAGRAWNARKQANRTAGRCPCGADVTPGYRTCARCRERGRLEKRRARRIREIARDNGIPVPREPGRRRALLAAYLSAFASASRVRDRRYRAMRHRARTTFLGWCELARGGEIAGTGTAQWEGHSIVAASRLWWRVRTLAPCDSAGISRPGG